MASPFTHPANDGATEALFDAARRGDASSCEAALARGADLDAEVQGRTLLTACAGAGQVDTLRWALGKGCDPSARTRSGWCPAGVAAYNNHADCLRLLLDTGVDPWDDALGSKGGFTTEPAAAWAVTRGDGALMQALVPHLGEIDRLDGKGNTLLGMAAVNDRVEAVRALLEAGARADARNRGGYAPLDLILSGQGRDFGGVAGLLLDAGALRDMPQQAAQALCRACTLQCAEVAEALLVRGADCNARDLDGTPAIVAAFRETADASRAGAVLLAHGACPDVVRQGENRTALSFAAWHDSMRGAEQLLRGGADVNVGLDKGVSALAFARSPEMARLLLDAGADPDVRLVAGRPTGPGRSNAEAAAKARLEATHLFLEQWQATQSRAERLSRGGSDVRAARGRPRA